jgi:hypothetical protein
MMVFIKKLKSLFISFEFMMRYSEIDSIDKRIKEKIEAAKKRKFFVKYDPNKFSLLIPELRRRVKDFKKALEPYHKTSWTEAWGWVLREALDYVNSTVVPDCASVWKYTFDAVEKAVLRCVNNEISNIGKAVVYGICRELSLYAYLEIVWESQREIKGRENPFEKYLEICEEGVYPRGFRIVDGREEFIIDVPLKSHKLGCVKEDDDNIFYTHGWNEDCSKIKPLYERKIV